MTRCGTVRQAALTALETVLAALSEQDHFAAAAPPLLAALGRHRELGAAEASVRSAGAWGECRV